MPPGLKTSTRSCRFGALSPIFLGRHLLGADFHKDILNRELEFVGGNKANRPVIVFPKNSGLVLALADHEMRVQKV